MFIIRYIALLSVFTLPFQYTLASEETSEVAALASNEILSLDNDEEQIDESGWKIITTDRFTANFPSKPKIDKRAGITTYSSLDSGTFPVVMYTLTVNKSKTSFEDAAEEVSKYLERLSTTPSNLLHHEIAESDDEIVVDTFCSDARTKVFRCERMIIVKDAIYTLTTLFFSNSAENHDYFVGHFVRT